MKTCAPLLASPGLAWLPHNGLVLLLRTRASLSQHCGCQAAATARTVRTVQIALCWVSNASGFVCFFLLPLKNRLPASLHFPTTTLKTSTASSLATLQPQFRRVVLDTSSPRFLPFGSPSHRCRGPRIQVTTPSVSCCCHWTSVLLFRPLPLPIPPRFLLPAGHPASRGCPSVVNLTSQHPSRVEARSARAAQVDRRV